ncbi:MAG: TonB-dependent receptor [Steroidobacteraceae bacterium]
MTIFARTGTGGAADGGMLWIARTALASCLLLALGATCAYAQDQTTQPAAPAQTQSQSEQSGALQEVVVTATRREQNVQNVPITVTAFTTQELQENNITDVHGLSEMAPGVNLDGGSPFSGDTSVLSASIRGIGQDDFAFNLNPGVGVYVDGVYLARTIGANQNLLDVDRIEILEGPQGTLFGANTIGGAINIVTHTPGDQFKVTAVAQGGSYDQRNFAFSADLPIIGHTLLSSITVSSQQQNGYQQIIPYPTSSVYGQTPFVVDPQDAYPKAPDEATYSANGGQNLQVIRGKVVWNASDNFKVTFAADWSHEQQPGMPETVLDVYNFPGNTFANLYNTCISNSAATLKTFGLGLVCGPRATGTGLAPGAAALAGAGYIGVGAPVGPFNYADTGGATYLGSPDPRLYWNYAATDTGNIDESYGDGPNFAQYDAFGNSVTVDWNLNDQMELKSITGYRQITWDIGTDLDGTPETLQEVTDNQHQWQVSQEFQILGKALDNKLNYVAGLYFFNEGGFVHDFVPFEGLLFIYDYSNNINNTDAAAFVHVDYQATDKLGFTAGGRYTDIWSTFNGGQADLNGFAYKITGCYPSTASASLIGAPASLTCQQALGFPDPAEPNRYVPNTTNSQNWRPFDPTLGAQYHFTDDIMGYVSWSEGFKQGGWTTRLSSAVLNTSALQFGPETDRTWELGVKSEWLDHHLLANADVFDTNYNNIQLNVQTGASPVYLNAGNAIIRGAELTTDWVVNNNFQFRFWGAYLDDYYTYVNPTIGIPASINPTTGAPDPGNPLSAQLPKTPRFKLGTGPQYSIPLPNAATLQFNGSFTYTTKMYNDSLNTPQLMRPDTRDLAAAVHYISPDDNYEVALGGTNITDDRYLTTGSINLAAGEVVGAYNPPREWYLNVRVNLGK